MFSKKKRIMSLLLALVVLTAGLCACGSKDTNTGGTAQTDGAKQIVRQKNPKSSRQRKQKRPGRIPHRKLRWSCI